MLMFFNKIPTLGLNVFTKQLSVSTLYSYYHCKYFRSGACFRGVSVAASGCVFN